MTAACELVIEMTPPYAQKHLLVKSKAGVPPIHTLTAPGVQGDAMFGTQGIGVSTPSAAAVAEATVGLASEEHIPKGKMFTIGRQSLIVASGVLANTFGEVTASAEGAAPKLQLHIDPAFTHIVITPLLPGAHGTENACSLPVWRSRSSHCKCLPDIWYSTVQPYRVCSVPTRSSASVPDPGAPSSG